MNKENKDSKSMGLWSATSIGVGAMIGAGIFALVGIAVEIAGKLAYLSFLIAGFIAFLTTYSVSKLAVKYPSKAGRVKYLNRAYGRGVIAGGLNITMWLGYVIVTSLYARAFGEYLMALLNLPDSSIWFYVSVSGIVLVFVGINFVGAFLVGKSELILAGAKVLVLVLFCVIGFFYITPSGLTEVQNVQISDVILASGVVFVSYEGFGLVANTAEDIEDPQKNLKRALFISVAIVMLVYVAVCVVVIGNLSIPRILEAKEYVLAEATRPFLGSTGFTIMAVAALISTSSAINATIYGPVYMLEETAKAKQLPPLFKRRLFKHESGVALLITGTLILVIANLLNLESIAEVGSLIFLVIYTAVNVANFKLRKETQSKALPVVAAIIGCTFALVSLIYFQLNQDVNTVILFVSLLAAGFLFEWWYQSSKRHMRL